MTNNIFVDSTVSQVLCRDHNALLECLNDVSLSCQFCHVKQKKIKNVATFFKKSNLLFLRSLPKYYYAKRQTSDNFKKEWRQILFYIFSLVENCYRKSHFRCTNSSAKLNPFFLKNACTNVRYTCVSQKNCLLIHLDAKLIFKDLVLYFQTIAEFLHQCESSLSTADFCGKIEKERPAAATHHESSSVLFLSALVSVFNEITAFSCAFQTKAIIFPPLILTRLKK